MLEHNINLNGYKTLMYCFGLSSSRYIEYTTALNFLEPEPGQKILDVGSGHSIFPSILKNEGFDAFVVDIARGSLIWQKNKIKNLIGSRRYLEVALSRGERLPFKDNTFSCVTAISVLEHIPDDKGVAREIGRVLKISGTCIVSVPATPKDKMFISTDWTSGIPSYQRILLRPALGVVFKKFNVDRDKEYLIRKYSMKDVLKRIVEPSGCVLEEFIPFENVVAKMIYNWIFPSGVLTPLEFLLVNKFTNIGTSTKNVGGIIIKMRKP